MTPEQINENIFTEFKTLYDPSFCKVFPAHQIKKIDKTKRTCALGFRPEKTERTSLGMNNWALQRDYVIPLRLWMPKEEPFVNNTILIGAFQIFFEKRTFQGVTKKSTRGFQPLFDPETQMTVTDLNFIFSVESSINNLNETPVLKTLTENVVSPAVDLNLRTEADEKLQTESDEDLLREEDAEV